MADIQGLLVEQETIGSSNYHVIIPKSLRDNAWLSSIGRCQRLFNEISIVGGDIQFDFLACRWIDPLPLLSLLIEIVRAKKLGCSISVLFPSSDDGPCEEEFNKLNQNSPNRLLLFLSREGFFSTLLAFGIPGYVGEKELSADLIDSLKNVNASPSYTDAHFIPVTLYDVPLLVNGGGVRDDFSHFSADAVENILKDAEVALHTRCSAPQRRHLLYNLRAVIQEFLHNVQEHAYDDEPIRLAGLYVRYRQGGVILTGVNDKGFYEECVNQEYKNCNMVSRDWLDSKIGCLELFFLDRGIGIVSHFTQGKASVDFEYVMRSTFFSGESTKKTRKTEHGGLKLLHTLLSRSTDYLRAVDNMTWFGCHVPFGRVGSQVVRRQSDMSKSEGLIGLGYHVRLGWNASTQTDDAWLSFSGDEIEQVFTELCKPPDSCAELFDLFDRYSIWDEFYANGDPLIKDEKYILWRPIPNRMKWDILSSMEDLSKRIRTGSTLVIVDIPSREAATYAAAMSNACFDRREKWPKKFKRIILVTNRWGFAYAEHRNYETGKHGYSTFATKDIPGKFKPGIQKKHIGEVTFRQLVVHWLKWLDSVHLWEYVNVVDRLFLAEPIIWSETDKHQPKEVISGYLDFTATVHHKSCAVLYRNALGRIFGLLDENRAEIIPVDNLASPVVHDVYAYEVMDPPESVSDIMDKVAVGSVLVSGSTLQATGLNNNIHFFVHGSAPQKNIYPSLFHWLPRPIVKTESPIQKRIGKTAAIAPSGWLSIEIPRHGSDGELVGCRDPWATYADWQNPGPMIAKLGHWHYEGHHDLITINIPDAVDNAFIRKTPLAYFLVNKIISFLGVRAEVLDQSWRESYPKEVTRPGILIYRSHPSSEHIMDRILSVLPEDARSAVSNQIFPILPLRTKFGASTLLIPPRMREEIRESNNNTRVMIFDDAAISGRTLQDLRTSLTDIGANNISFVLIANRLRMPAEAKNIDYYWRLDVPTMGREGSCALCSAWHQVDSFSKQLVNGSSAEILEKWLKDWGAVSPLTNWHAGLNPMPIPLVVKKYCYKPNSDPPEYRAEIPIFRSTGLSIHAAEIHAMTARDDYGLKKIKEQREPAVRIELAASQLLLFGDELDHDLIHDFIVYGLLKPMSELPENSPSAALAVFVVIRTLTLLSRAGQINVADTASQNAIDLQSRSHGLILVAYFLMHNLFDSNNDIYYPALRLLSSRHASVPEKLRYLFRETITIDGNAHSEPLPRLHRRLKDVTGIEESEVRRALDSLASIEDIVKELGSELARCAAAFGKKEDGYSDRRIKLARSIVQLRESLKFYINSDKYPDVSLVENVINDINQLADCYFYRLDPREGQRGRGFRESLEALWSNGEIRWTEAFQGKPGSIESFDPIIMQSKLSGLSSNFDGARWVWIPWHKHIVSLIKDLLMNVIHRTGQIHDPWDDGVVLADMWVNVNYEPKRVLIRFATGCSKDISVIYRDIEKGTVEKTRWEPLCELGGKVSLDEVMSKQGERLVLEVSIPYASYIGKEHQEESA